MAQTHAEAVQMVISVMRDGRRLDRHLQIADDGHYYTTSAHTYSGQGADARPFVHIPEGYEVGEESEEESREGLSGSLAALPPNGKRKAVMKSSVARLLRGSCSPATHFLLFRLKLSVHLVRRSAAD